MERGLPDGRPKLAAELGASHSDVLVRARNQEGDLYNEHDWITEYDATENYQKSSDVPVGRSGFQDTLSCLEKYQQTMDNADTELERSDESIRYTFREQTAQ